MKNERHPEIRARLTAAKAVERELSNEISDRFLYYKDDFETLFASMWDMSLLLGENEQLARENAALKKAIKDGEINFEFSLACETCACKSGCTYNRANGCVERHYVNWQFDAARFSGEVEGL